MSRYDKANKKKASQLGMPIGTATHKLRKSLLFSLVQQTDQDTCYQCGEKINRVEDLSIEHKERWMDSEDPVGLFFDLNNISFSHLSCNISVGSRDKYKRMGLSGRFK